MNLRGWNGGSVRPPLIDLDEAQRAALEGIVRPLLRMAQDMQDTGDARGQAPERAA
jgi:dihydrodipicolinate synthase/N-acetylneuraminate lyase